MQEKNAYPKICIFLTIMALVVGGLTGAQKKTNAKTGESENSQVMLKQIPGKPISNLEQLKTGQKNTPVDKADVVNNLKNKQLVISNEAHKAKMRLAKTLHAKSQLLDEKNLASVKSCFPQIDFHQGIDSSEVLGEVIKADQAYLVKEDLVVENIHIQNQNGEKKLIQTYFDTDKAFGEIKAHTRIWTEDRDGFPIPSQIPSNLSHLSREELINRYVENGTPTFHEVRTILKSKDLEAQVTYTDGAISEVSISTGKSYLSCQNSTLDDLRCFCHHYKHSHS